MKVRSPELAEKCLQKYERLIGPLRTRAAACGYALAVHGSLARDIDLLAVPWIENAMSVEDFVAAMIDEIDKINGCAYARYTDESGRHEFTSAKPYKRPHGRLAWEIHLGGGPYVDLSVMPRLVVVTA